MATDDGKDRVSDIPPNGGADIPAPEPMSATLMARLFIVPAIIVCVLLAVAVVVVLFGTTTSDKPQTVAALLERLEADTGERTLGYMLMPRAKEAWQASQELARRFEQRDKFLEPVEIEPTAQRLIKILAKYPPGRNVDEPGPAQQYFLIMALARLHTASGVEPLVALLRDENWWTRSTALQALAEMQSVPEAGGAIPAILPLLNDPVPAVQIVACATISCLAEKGDAAAVRALADRLEGEAEVQWNAAMALARLGSRSGKLVLLNMLSRDYWEGLDLQYMENGAPVRRKYSEAEVSRNLKSAIEAAAILEDADLAAAIAQLDKDRSVAVREAARVATGQSAVETAPGRTASKEGASMSSLRHLAAGENS